MMIGLPASGKTSFLAAFWFMVDQMAVQCGFTINKLVGERKYLNQICDAWLQLKPVPRNQFGFQKLVSMSLNSRATNTPIALQFPDLSGETFRQQWAKRQLTVSYDSLLRVSGGALLFVSPDIVKPHRLDTLEELAKLVPNAADDASAVPKRPKDWDIEKAPTQIQLVELLQAIATRDYFRPRFRLALVVSAYDRVISGYSEPKDFVAKELPLLSQFLRSNSDLFDVMVFGVSAQGGIYASPLLLADMVTDLDDIRTKLLNPANDFSGWLAKTLEPGTMEALTDGKVKMETKQLLADDFNRLMGRIDLHEPARFASVKLREETNSYLEEILEKEVKDTTEIRMLNRMLLEDAFPKGISKKWQNRKEHKHLADLPAAERVLVYGETVKNKHDITEPIQWLMS
jgi:hypothetical protein